MKMFMAVYTGNPSAFEKYQRENPDPGKRKANEKAGMEAWMKWGESHAKSIVDNGAPLGKTKRVTATSVASVRNEVTGYTIVEAESHDAAAAMLVGHPHLNMPGAYVDVLSVTPIPGM